MDTEHPNPLVDMELLVVVMEVVDTEAVDTEVVDTEVVETGAVDLVDMVHQLLLTVLLNLLMVPLTLVMALHLVRD